MKVINDLYIKKQYFTLLHTFQYVNYYLFTKSFIGLILNLSPVPEYEKYLIA